MTLDEPIAARGYQYKHGDRPLDGYTIQRGVGRGGFGEVYYALSDSGREVALKVVNTYEQVELRGISQCMNLKSPHLVTIFDVKYGEDSRPWVIMEFVAGPSLAELLAAAPAGLGSAKAAFFLREIGKGLTYLHDCGIVHRDLKPANIFYENGVVKIGDYGLSKAMSATRHSGQTVAVGTLHYMAPEIGEGCYDRSIDIYALGALLYELLTGQVPFHGSSPAEVLMKHLSSEVNLDNVEEPFKSVIRKAMAKNPAERYQSASEMVEAVFGFEQIRSSVAQVTPESLTMVAGRVAGAAGSGNPPPRGSRPPVDQWEALAQRVGERLAYAGERIKNAGDRVADRMAGGRFAAYAAQPSGSDPMSPPLRMAMAAVAVILAAFLAFTMAPRRYQPETYAFVLLVTSGAVAGAMVGWRLMARGVQGESKWVQRLAIGGPAACGALLFGLPTWASHDFQSATIASFFVLLLIHWEERLLPDRRERFSVGHLFTSGLLALVLAGMMDAQPFTVITVACGASLAVSLAARWDGRSYKRPFFPTPAYPTPPSPRPAAAAGPSPSGPPPIVPPQGNPQAAQPGPVPPPMRYRDPRQHTLIGGVLAALLVITLLRAAGNGHTVFGLPMIFLAPFIVFLIFKGQARSAGWQMGSAPADVMGVAGSFFRSILSLVGGLLLMVSLLLALAVLTNLPGLFQSGALNPGLPDDFRRAFGSDDWPATMIEIGTAASIITALASLSLLLLSRRYGGGLHLVRTLLGIGVMFGAIKVLARALPNWAWVPLSHNFNAALNWYFQHASMNDVVHAAILASIAMIIFGWPPKRRFVVAPNPPPGQ